MKAIITMTFVALMMNAYAQIAPPSKAWDKRFGGSNEDGLESLQQTTDGGYILGGRSQSGIGGDKTEDSRGLFDFWGVKIDANGIRQWDKRFGGSGWDLIRFLQQTTDGGFILGGDSESGIGGDKTEDSRGLFDFWVVKTDSNGIKQWDKRFGGSADYLFTSIQQTNDGGYILGGVSYSGIGGDKTESSWGDCDFWVVKIDANGIKQWDKRFGGSSLDLLISLQQTTDGGFILGGYSYSSIDGDKSEVSRGSADYWVVKIDANGIKQWDKRFGGSGIDNLRSIKQTTDGGYVLGGYSTSGIGGDKTEASRGGEDYWVVKIDLNGIKQWDKRFGGTSNDWIYLIQQTIDGGYILGGQSFSGISGDKTEASWGGYDYWLVKIDINGLKQWDKRFGGNNTDDFFSLQQTADGGYILGGDSYSGINGDKTEASRGSADFWVVKLKPDGTLPLNFRSFSAKLEGVASQLSWQTATEINTKSFTIQRSANSRDFTTIGIVSAKGSNNNYSFTDNLPMQGTNYYHLLITDNDGSTIYSEIRSINFSNNNITARIYPNPVKEQLTIELNSKTASKASITITNAEGKTIQQLTTQLQSGNNKITMPVAGLVSGTYMLQVNTNTGQQVMKFVKQ